MLKINKGKLNLHLNTSFKSTQGVSNFNKEVQNVEKEDGKHFISPFLLLLQVVKIGEKIGSISGDVLLDKVDYHPHLEKVNTGHLPEVPGILRIIYPSGEKNIGIFIFSDLILVVENNLLKIPGQAVNIIIQGMIIRVSKIVEKNIEGIYKI